MHSAAERAADPPKYSYIDGGDTGQTQKRWSWLPTLQGPMADRYARPRRPSRSEDEWHGLAEAAVLALLERELAVTIVEMEAKLSDRTYDPLICPDPINPHHLTTARHTLADEGRVEAFTAVTKSKSERGVPDRVTTWSLPRIRGRKTAIDRAAERKRALTSRWYSWGRRNLLGEAGESALMATLLAAPALTYITGSTTSLLGVQVNEVDNSAVYVHRTKEGALTPIQLVFEVKNTREHYYADRPDVLVFLAKAALIQHRRPDQLVLPVFVCRRWHWTLWEEGQRIGFLPVMVVQQLVRKDPDLHSEEWATRFGEVRDELFADLRVVTSDRPTTNRHRGIVNGAIPRYALDYARLWQHQHSQFL